MHIGREQNGPDESIERQQAGLCWNCAEPKKNPYGLCVKCGRFGMAENEIERRLLRGTDEESGEEHH